MPLGNFTVNEDKKVVAPDGTVLTGGSVVAILNRLWVANNMYARTLTEIDSVIYLNNQVLAQVYGGDEEHEHSDAGDGEDSGEVGEDSEPESEDDAPVG